ncbi:hypothetical protein C0J45_15689 [Silurus meridionalis]|nr:hypothetical protein C0J45_15689 [Silurus meridionalis]
MERRKKKYSKSVVEVKRVSDRVMNMKLEVEEVMINVISADAPQVGCEMKKKEKFWSELDEVVEGVPRKERLVIGADFNGHVGEGNRGDEELWYCMRKSVVSERYVRVLQDMNKDKVTAVKCAVGTTDWFEVKGGTATRISSEPFPVCSGDGQVDRRGQTGVFIDYDVCG